MRASIVTGRVFPDYDLTDHTGERRKLSDLQDPEPMILVLSRGGYCPKDLRQAEAQAQLHREMDVGYCRLVTISTDNLLTTNEYRTAPSGKLLIPAAPLEPLSINVFSLITKRSSLAGCVLAPIAQTGTQRDHPELIGVR